MKEVDDLQHSNMFRLQMEELIAEISLKEKHTVKLKKWKDSFTNYVKSLKRSKQFQLKENDWRKEHELPIPLSTYPNLPDVMGVFEFFPPEEVNFVGSFANQLATTHSPVVDLALVMPKEFMQHNDLANCRWLLRRVLYLSWLGRALKEKPDLVGNVSWTYHCGSYLRPVLKVSPAGKLGEKWKIHLFPVPPNNYFKLSHISPCRSSVSLSWYFKKEKQQGDFTNPTPNYNWACGVDVVMLHHNQFILENLHQSNWIEGIKLLNLWLAQRYLNRGEGGISSHVMSLLVIYLIQNRKIILQMSPYQVFRTVLLYLSQSDWKKNGISLSVKQKSDDRNEVLLTVDDFQKYYSIVFVDSTGYLNLVASTFHATFLEMQYEAKKALQMLECSFVDCFEALFIQKVEFYLAYDQIIKIDLDEKNISRILKKKVIDTSAVLLDSLGDKRRIVFEEITSLLMKAFDNRLDLMGVLKKETAVWSFNENPPPLRKSLTLGLLLNPTNGCALLTKGPSADSSEAFEFREFWGDISGMRRFQDSTFHEAVLWGDSCDPVGDRRLIPGKIANHILNRHLHIPTSKISYIAGQLEHMIKLPTHQFSYKYGTGEEANSMAIVAFDQLAKKIRSLELPIQIATIQSTSDVLKHTLVFPPIARSSVKRDYGSTEYTVLERNELGCPIYRYAMDVQLLLEMSGKWPDDLLAIQAMKAEFHCKIAELLKSEGLPVIVFPTFVQIIWEGYIFRVKVIYRREIYLLRLVKKTTSGIEEFVEEETEESIQLEKETEILPRLTSSINSIQSDHPSFSGSVRLIRRWVSSQLLIPHLPYVVLDLLVAYLFTNLLPHKAPNTPHVALLRFWHFMALTDWKTTPVIVNLKNQLSGNDIAEILKIFNNMRSHYPPLFLCSPCELRHSSDESSNIADSIEGKKRFRLLSCFSRPSPSITILARMKSIASAALQSYTVNMYSKNIDFKVLFRPSLEDYDLVITLNRLELARRREALDFKQQVICKPYCHFDGERMPPVMFDPVQCYLKELRDGYDQHALFFHDEHGGDVIGVVWKPQAKTPKPAKVSSIKGHRISGAKDFVQEANIEAIIEDFKVIGNGLVINVKLKEY